MDVISLKESKDRKDGKVTALSVTENLLEAVKKGEVKRIVYAVITDDDEVLVGYNTGSILESLGLLEVAKQELADEMRE